MFKKNLNDQKLEESILEVLEALALTDPLAEEYAILTQRLRDLKDIANDSNRSNDKLTKDTLLIVGGNLAGILAIINYERLNVVTTKAFQLLMKVK